MENISYHFKRPEELSPDILDEIRRLIESTGEVGTSWIEDNLFNARMIGYAKADSAIIGTMTIKVPLEKYLRQINEKTGLDLQGYLERGYSAIKNEYHGIGIGDALLKGLMENCQGEKVYTTIRQDNTRAINLTLKNKMKLAAMFLNDRTGHEIGVYVN